jgi:hypothetical protein
MSIGVVSSAARVSVRVKPKYSGPHSVRESPSPSVVVSHVCHWLCQTCRMA